MFTDAVGRRLRGDYTNASLRRLLAGAGLRAVPFHALRHSVATALLAEGVSPRVVMDQLGHSQISTTMNTYSHVTAPLRRDAADAIDRALSDT